MPCVVACREKQEGRILLSLQFLGNSAPYFLLTPSRPTLNFSQKQCTSSSGEKVRQLKKGASPEGAGWPGLGSWQLENPHTHGSNGLGGGPCSHACRAGESRGWMCVPGHWALGSNVNAHLGAGFSARHDLHPLPAAVYTFPKGTWQTWLKHSLELHFLSFSHLQIHEGTRMVANISALTLSWVAKISKLMTNGAQWMECFISQKQNGVGGELLPRSQNKSIWAREELLWTENAYLFGISFLILWPIVLCHWKLLAMSSYK